MVSDNSGNGGDLLVYGHKLSTVVSASVTGDDASYDLANMDLAVKLHYLRAVYYFKAGGLGIAALKEPMFPLLDVYYPVVGRVRWSESGGRPRIKCNDSGLRIIEARCDRTLDEWMEVEDPSRYRHLLYDKVLGPDIYFSPTTLIQFTWFKCGGLAVGFCWAHVLGDAVSATNFINLWGELIAGKLPPKPKQLCNSQTKREKPGKEAPAATKPLSVKQEEPIKDCWLPTNRHKMVTFSLQISDAKLRRLQSEISSDIPPFEALSALIWQCLARVRIGREPKLVTVCRNDISAKRSMVLSNEQIISTVTSECSPTKIELSELAMLLKKQAVDETAAVEELIDRESGKPDILVYGANLTFVDMQGLDLYGLELKGQKPLKVDYCIDGVGDEGVVLVLPGPEKANGGRVVTLILPEDQMYQLREVLQCEWGLA